MTDLTPPPANPDGIQDIETEILKVASLVTAARRLLADNKMVDLSALSGKVLSLCEAINRKSPAEDSVRIISSVNEISGDLDRLSEELISQHEGVSAMYKDATSSLMISAYDKARDKS